MANVVEDTIRLHRMSRKRCSGSTTSATLSHKWLYTITSPGDIRLSSRLRTSTICRPCLWQGFSVPPARSAASAAKHWRLSNRSKLTLYIRMLTPLRTTNVSRTAAPSPQGVTVRIPYVVAKPLTPSDAFSLFWWALLPARNRLSTSVT